MRKWAWAWVAAVVFLAACSRKGSELAVRETPEAAEEHSEPDPGSPSSAYFASAASAPAVLDAARDPISIPRGAFLRVRLEETVNTRRNRAGDAFRATLEAPVIAEGRMLLPAGTPFWGHVTASDASGRMRGHAVLGLTLDSFQYQGREFNVRTSRFVRESESHASRNIGLIAGGSGLGAIIGAIAGGGKGAALGAVVGAGAGTAGAAATGKLEVGLPPEAPLTFQLQDSVEL